MNGVELLVTDGKEPVEEYAVYMRGSPPTESAHHPHGRTFVRGIREGEYQLRVRPASPTLSESPFHEVRFGAGAPIELRVDLTPAAEQPVVVRAGSSAEGLPIGVQVVARPWREDVALAVARHIEEALGGWRAPPGLPTPTDSRQP